MRLTSNIIFYVRFQKQFKKRKFDYSLQFVSYRNKVRLRLLEVYVKGKVMYFQKDKEWNQVCFLSRVLNRFYYNEEIPFKSFPEDIRGLKQLQHYKVPIEVKKKIKDKLGRELDPVIAKT